MGLIASVKDLFGDALGVYDDLRDFADFAKAASSKLQKKANVAKRTVALIEREVVAAETVSDLESGRLRGLKAVLSQLKSETVQLKRDTTRVLGKIGSVSGAKEKLGPTLRRAVTNQSRLLAEIARVEPILKAAEVEQRALINRLRAEEDAVQVKRQAAKSWGRLAGALAAVVGVGTVVARVMKVL